MIILLKIFLNLISPRKFLNFFRIESVELRSLPGNFTPPRPWECDYTIHNIKNISWKYLWMIDRMDNCSCKSHWSPDWSVYKTRSRWRSGVLVLYKASPHLTDIDWLGPAGWEPRRHLARRTLGVCGSLGPTLSSYTPHLTVPLNDKRMSNQEQNISSKLSSGFGGL